MAGTGRSIVWTALLAAGASGCCIGCGNGPDQTVETPPRPVTVVELKATDPTSSLLLTGSVESWKQQDIGFEVSGRVEWVVEPGKDVEGRTYDENNNVITEGAALARLDQTRYQLRVTGNEAQVRSADAQATAIDVEIQGVLPQQLNAAEAEQERAEKEFARADDLMKRDATTAADRDRADAALKTARAKVEQIKATMSAKRAELESMRAQVAQAEESVRQARVDLEDCTLVAPFSGRVAQVHVIPGAYVQPGGRVVTLILMDPIRVDVAVSPATDRMVHYGDLLQIFPPGADPSRDKPVIGWVYMKDAVADPATRTFKVTVMIRNRRVAAELPSDPELLKLPRIGDITVLETEKEGEPGPLFVDHKALCQDDQGYYVWKVENLNLPADAEQVLAEQSFEPVLKLRRVPVVPGERRLAILGYLYRELADTGSLEHFEPLALGVPEGIKDGDRVLFVRQRWQFRPGDLVRVGLKDSSPGAGFYVPMEAILREGDLHHVFVVFGSADDNQKARKVPVQVMGAVGELRCITGESIQEGTQVILEGAHYLIPDEPVKVVGTKM